MKINFLIFSIIYSLLFSFGTWASYKEDESMQVNFSSSYLSHRSKNETEGIEIHLPNEIWLKIMSIKGTARFLFAVNRQCNRLAYSRDLSGSLYHNISNQQAFDDIKHFLPTVLISFPLKIEHFHRLSMHSNLHELYIKSQIKSSSMQVLAQTDLSHVSTLRLGEQIKLFDISPEIIEMKMWLEEKDWLSSEDNIKEYLLEIQESVAEEQCFEKRKWFWYHLEKEKNKPYIGLEGINYLKEGKFSILTDLDLSGNKIPSEGLLVLAGGKFRKLKFLNLSSNEISNPGIKIVHPGSFTHLESLNLSANFLKDEDLKKLACAKFKNLKILNLSNNEIMLPGIEIFHQDSFPNLEDLNLSLNFLKNEGITALRSCYFPKLEKINLSNTQADDEGIVNFVQGNFPQLWKINLENNYDIEDIRSLIAFYEGNLFPFLYVNLQNTSIDSIEIADFIKYFEIKKNFLKEICLSIDEEDREDLCRMKLYSNMDIQYDGIYILTKQGKYIKFPYVNFDSNEW